MSALGGKPDMAIALRNVRLWPRADKTPNHNPLPLSPHLLCFNYDWRRLKPRWRGCMRRRDLIKVIAGSLAVWPLAARAQQVAMPVIGFLGGGAPEKCGKLIPGFRRGLGESGSVEGRKLSIGYPQAAKHKD